jgi:hypothetical protein
MLKLNRIRTGPEQDSKHMRDLIDTNGIRRRVGTVLVLAGVALSSARAGAPATPSNADRYRALVAVVHRNLGFAHFTRGVNVCTVLALHDAATPADIAVLSAMLHDPDRLVGMAAAKTLGSMGEEGAAVLRRARDAPGGPRRADVQDALDNPLNGVLDRYRTSGECG